MVEEFEATLELFARVLEFYEIPTNTIHRELHAVRNEHYRVLREGSLADLQLDALRHLGIHGALDVVEVEDGAAALGENSTSLNLRRVTGATVIAVVRSGKARLVKILERPAGQQFAPSQRPLESAIAVGYVFQFSGRSCDGLEDHAELHLRIRG